MTNNNYLTYGTRKILGKDFDVNKAYDFQLIKYSLLCDIGLNKAYEKRNELKQVFNNYIDEVLNDKIPSDLNDYINKGNYVYPEALADIKEIINDLKEDLEGILETIETPKLFKDYSRRQFLTDLNYQLETKQNIYLDEVDKIYKRGK